MSQVNSIQWQPWQGIENLPNDANLLFYTIQHNAGGWDAVNFRDFALGARLGKCEIYPYNQAWKYVENDGTFDGGRITHYAIITEPEN